MATIAANHTEAVYAYVDERMSRKEMNNFWSVASSDRSLLHLFYSLLIEKWHNKSLSPNLKDQAVKLYKENSEFRELYVRYEMQKM